MNTFFKCLWCLLLFLLSTGVVLEAQPVVQIRGYNKLYLLDLTSGAESLLYASPYQEIRTVKISSDGSLFALMEIDHSSPNRTSHLKVLDDAGNLVYEGQPNGKDFGWDPKSNRLAYITGIYNGGSTFSPTGFYINDFLLNKETPIATDGFKPFRLNWINNSTENSIYIESISSDKAKHFLRYNVLRDIFEVIPFSSIDVSPDSNYYSYSDGSCRCIKIFNYSTSTEQSRISLSDTDAPVGWAYNQNHLYAVEKIIYNKEQQQLVIGGKLKTASFNGTVKEATIVVLDGNNGQQVQMLSGVVPSRVPYENMFAKPDVLLSVSVGTAANARQASSGNRSQITVTEIPDKYR